MFNKIRNIFFAGVGILTAAGPAHADGNTEQPKYDIIKKSDGAELRNYAPHLVAEVTVEARSMRQASSKGFGPLADYIFGHNQRADTIAMTAPVTTQPKSNSTEIAMTAPVTTSQSGDGMFIVRFSIPSKWTMATLPIPNNDDVKLIEIDAERRVAYRLLGNRSQARIDQASAQIKAFLKAEKLEASSSLIIAGYDGPSVPTELKRWEVMQIVK